MPERPNVVVIMTDQQRADACAREGFDLDTTPFLDQLAAEGTWFNRAYTSTPVCAPARTGMLTGRFPTASGIWTNNSQRSVVYDRDLFDVVDDAGYQTAMIGKNHSHLDSGHTDEWVHLSHWGAYGDAKERRTGTEEAFDDWLSQLSTFNEGGGFSLDPTPYPPETQCAARCVRYAEDWIDSIDGDDPFFMWLSFPEPHNPFQVPEPYYDMFPPEELPPLETGVPDLASKRFKWTWLRTIAEERTRRKSADLEYDEVLARLRSNYYGMLRLIDDQVQRFVESLESAGLRDDTLVIFLSDHGDFVGEYGLERKGVDLPEMTARIPLLVNGPDLGVEATDGPHPAHVSIVDLLPTICEAVDEPIPDGVQGRSLWPLLRGEPYPETAFESIYAECGYGGRHVAPEETPPLKDASVDELNAYTQTGRTAMVRQEDWKLVVDMQDGVELYNVADDPVERRDLAVEPSYADVREDLMEEWARWTLRVRDTLGSPYETLDEIYENP